MNIETVKLQSNGYLLNGTMSVPMADGNKEFEAIKEWLKSNTPEPEFTEEELKTINNNKLIHEAKQYLIDTDYKVLPDYDGNTIGILEARAEARTLIRSLEAK
jgi:cytochrome oxidase Cu insertion factor (SCO1/SenC/PrrC family)